MADLERFREQVTIYRKRQVNPATGRSYTLGALARTIGLSADELGHRLNGNGRVPLTQENVLAIVRTLAEWDTLTWEEAVELFVCMGYPLDQPGWQTDLQRFLGPPPRSVQQTIASRVALPGTESSSPGRRRLFQARDLPRDYVPRPTVFEAVKHQLLLPHNGLTTALTSALRGAGGFGKTTLALALCHDSEIQAAFPDGILWVELGEHPPRPLDVLNGVLQALDPSLSGALTLEEARDRWRHVLEHRSSLLVIDDVWTPEALGPLLESGPQCTRLITTRNDLLLPKEVPSEARIWVDAMEPGEAMAVLCQGLEEQMRQTASQQQLLSPVTRLGRWPLLLKLARGMLETWLTHGKTVEQALSIVEHAYEARSVRAFHLASEDERQRTVEACLDVSLRHLNTFTPAHYDATARYEELAIFPEDTEIPIAALRLFWRTRAGLESWEVDHLCIQLHSLSLVQSCDLGRDVLRLHDVIRAYLIQHSRSPLPELHAHFLDSLKQGLSVQQWAEVPFSNRYLWQHLLWHLCQAGCWAEVAATLTDLRYLTAKAWTCGASALEGELAQIHATLSEPSPLSDHDTDQDFAFLPALQRRASRLSNLLRRCVTLADMGSVVLTHLGQEAPFAEQRLLLEQMLPRPYLATWHPLPDITSPALLRTLIGHTGRVKGCAISADGRTIVSASDDKTLKVWDAASGTERFTISSRTSFQESCAVSADGRVIVSASSDNTLKVWDGNSGAERFTLAGHTNRVNGCAISADGRVIVSASHDGTLKVWDGASGVERLTLSGHTSAVTSCAVSADGRVIVSASYDGTLKVWDGASGAERFALFDGTGVVVDCAMSADGQVIVSASDDQTLKIWDGASKAERLTLSGKTNQVMTCAMSADGRVIVSASWDSTLKVWDGASGAERFTISTGHKNVDRRSFKNIVTDCAVSADGRVIVSASSDSTLKVWDGNSGAERFTLSGHPSEISSCAISADGQVIISASDIVDDDGSTLKGILKVWDGASGAERFTLFGHENPVTDCAVSADGRVIVSVSGDDMIKVWDGVSGVERFTLFYDGGVNGCAVSADGQVIVLIPDDDNTLMVGDGDSGAKWFILSGHTDQVMGCAVSANGRVIVSVSLDHTLKLWDGWTGQCLLTFPVEGLLYRCALQADGERLVACGDQGVYFLRLVV